MRLVNAEVSFPNASTAFLGWTVSGVFPGVWWIEESGEQRHENEARQRPFPVDPAGRATRVHGDAFSTSAVKALRQTCGAYKMILIALCLWHTRAERTKAMNRKLLWLLTVFLLGSIQLAEAQQSKRVPRIGYLSAGSASSNLPRMEAFRQGLRDLGYIEGKNISVDYRFAEGEYARLPDLAVDLVHLNVNIMLQTPPSPHVQPSKQPK